MQRIAQILVLVILASVVSAGVVDKAGARKANNEGIDLATKGKLDKSVSAFSKAMELDPSNGEYVNNLGVSQMRMGHLDAAESNFRKALKLEPHNPDARTNLADLLRYLESSGKRPVKKEAAKPIDEDEDDEDEDDEDEDDDDDEEEEEEVVSHKSKSKGSAGKDKSSSKKETPKPTPTPKVRKPHPRKPLPVIHIRDLYKPENTKYAMGDRPFKLVGAMDKWPALTKWTDSWISSTFPDSIVDFYPHNMDKSDTHPYLTKMSQALSELWKPSGAFPDNKKHPGTYLQWNIHVPEWQRLREDMDLPWKFMHDEVWLEECLSTETLRDEYNKKTHWRMMLIGNKGAGMFGHVDVLRTSSWQAQFRGAKKWFLCDPAQKQYLYHAGDVDAWDWNPETHPLFDHAECYEDIVRAGEMFYYPRDYWHQTLNLETPSMSISGTICDHHNFDTIATELKNECDFQKFKWGFSKELCAELPKCWKLWKDRWRPENQEKCDAAGKR